MKRFLSWFKRVFGSVKPVTLNFKKPSCLRCGREMYGNHFFYCGYCYDVLDRRNHY